MSTEQLRRLRQSKNFTQANLAGAVGVGVPYISRIESGQERPTAALLSRVATELGADASQRVSLFADYGRVPPEIVAFLLANPAQTVALYEFVIALSEAAVELSQPDWLESNPGLLGPLFAVRTHDKGVSETPPLGDRIRARRVGRGMTLAAVAESAGLSLPYVSNLERGRGNPTLEALQAIARALDMPLSELVADREEHVGGDLVLAQAPASLLQFARSPRFQSAVQRLASEHSCSAEDMRQRLLVGMVSAPRRGSGEPTEEDWRRLLDVYTVILADE